MAAHIYLDYNSTTPLAPRVLNVFMDVLQRERGNPSSLHFHGRQSRRLLDQSREEIARFFRVRPHEVLFTSGGTEGAALLLRGFLALHPQPHVITSEAEHSCVYQTLKQMEKKGTAVTFLPVGVWGAVRPAQVEEAIRPETQLITLMGANNETGVLTDIEGVAALAKKRGIPFIVDGVAWLGKESFSLPPGVSAIFFSGHKIYAPKGVGFCICRQGLKLEPLFVGGGQEYQRRSGTENVAAIAALAEAIRLLAEEGGKKIPEMRRLRDRFEQELVAALPHVIVNGEGPRVSNTSNLSFLGMEGEALLIYLDREGLSVSHGSACASGALEPSRILLSMGMPLSQARASLRFSIGYQTTEEEISEAVKRIVKAVRALQT